MSRNLRELVADAFGLDAESLGRGALERAAGSRMRALGVTSLDAYAARLAVDAAERAALAELVVVPETWFFRDVEPFNCLAAHLLAVSRERPGRPLRVLSAPCATGEEPYSAAIALLRAGIAPDAFEIVAADLSAVALERARRGVYGASSFRGVNADQLGPWIEPEAGGFRPHPQAAARVRFLRANLCASDFCAGEGSFDAVLCRNLLIYLTPPARRNVLASLDRLLLPGGLLLTGHSEIMLLAPLGYESVPHPRSFARRKPLVPKTPEKSASSETALTRTPTASACRPALLPGPDGTSLARSAPGSFDDAAGAAATRLADMPALAAAKAVSRVRSGPLQSVGAAGNGTPRSAASLDLARRLADAGRLDEAGDICREALAACPHEAEAHALHGLLAMARGRHADAEAAFSRALYLCPTHREALAHLALAAERRGDAARAELLLARLARSGNAETEGAS